MQALGDRAALLIGFLAGFLSVGIPYWIIPYQKLGLPDAIIGFGLVVVALAALLLRARRVAPIWKTTLIVGASVPAVVLSRALVEGLIDPTSHNLWPFELVIALPIGFAAALIGAVAGTLLALLLARSARP
jgi:hypothetical protein